jgi:molybdopterin-containing oxidoreductase family iron-sulfur binding subunit
VTCVDGRPIKVEGNPKHPNSLGATNAYAQAAILELYDPNRSRHIIEKTPEGDMVRSWEQFTEFAKKHFEESEEWQGLVYSQDRTPTSFSRCFSTSSLKFCDLRSRAEVAVIHF